MSEISKNNKCGREPMPLGFLCSCVLLSLVDYAVIRIEMEDIGSLAAQNGSFTPDMIFSSPSTVMNFVLWAALLVLRMKAPKATGSTWVDWVFSGVFAFALPVLHTIYQNGDYSAIAANRDCLLLFGFTVAGLTLLCRHMILWLKAAFASVRDYPVSLPSLWKKHPFLFPFAVIFLLWLPFAVMKYPAGTEFDSYYQLYQIMGYAPLTNHWPVSSGVIYGVCYTLGKTLFGSMSAGLFTLIVCQMLFCAACFAWSVRSMQRLGVKEPLLILTLFVFTVFTVISRYCTALNKDCWFCGALLVFLSFCAEYLFGVRKFGMKDAALFVSLGLVMGILRSNGPYILILWAGAFFVFGLLLRNRLFGKLFASMLAAFLLCSCYLNVLLPALNIPGASIREALSVPFMQTARYVKYYGEEVTPEEKAIIDSVLDYDVLAEVYDDRLSDPVKSTYHGEGDDLMQYFGVWVRQGLRHPKVYIDATLNNICGFFYPGAVEREEGIYVVSNWEEVFDEYSDEYHAERYARLKPYTNWIYAFENFPPFYLLSNFAVHIWLLAYMFLAAASRKQTNQLLLLIPSIVSVLICIAGPTFTHNGYRYVLPVVFMSFYLIGTASVSEKE